MSHWGGNGLLAVSKGGARTFPDYRSALIQEDIHLSSSAGPAAVVGADV